MRGRKPAAHSVRSLRLVQGGKTKGVRLEPCAPREPDWTEKLGDNAYSAGAAVEWARVVPILEREGIIARLDGRLLEDYCICCAQLDEANRAVAKHGFGEGAKNPAVTAANQIRAQLKFYISEIGMSPTSRMRMNLPDGDEDDLDLD